MEEGRGEGEGERVGVGGHEEPASSSWRREMRPPSSSWR